MRGNRHDSFQVINETKEMYSIYEQSHYSMCRTAPNFLLRPEINPLHPLTHMRSATITAGSRKNTPNQNEHNHFS